MGCCGDREKHGDLRREQKWDYINLDDFKSTSCWTPFAYCYLLIMFLVSISVYVVDIFTAVNLLVFDKWSGQIEPAVPFAIMRWIFAGCIALSLLLLLYRWLRAIRVMQQGGVAKSYLDPLAIRIQSIRMGSNGRGWKRFLVFAELTKSRKGADYVALFTYYSFEAWLRIVFAEGPRQVVNAITLYTVLRLQLLPTDAHPVTDGHTPVVQFFVNIGILADSNKLRAVILFGMLWTLFIWVISALSLIASVVLYLLFLWHHIPSEDGSLKKYCRNKINRRMERIVRVKVDKALKKENEIRARQETRAARDGTMSKKQPTLPDVGGPGFESAPALSRQTTVTTLPEYTSRPATHRASNDTLPSLTALGDTAYHSRPSLKRSATHASETSWSSYNSNAPLINHQDAVSPDYGRVQTPGTVGPGTGQGPWNTRPSTARSLTGNYSQRSQSSGPPRPGTSNSHRTAPGAYPMEPIPRPPTSSSNMRRPSPPIDVSPIDGHPFSHSNDRIISPASTTSGHVLPYPLAPHERQRDFYDSRSPSSAGPRHLPFSSDERGRSSPFEGSSLHNQASAHSLLDRSHTPAVYPERSFTPAGPPPIRTVTPMHSDRSFTPSVPPPYRSMTPGAPPERSFTPAGPPPGRSTNPGVTSQRAPSPFREPALPVLPTLPRLQTSGPYLQSGYGPLTSDPQSVSPISAGPFSAGGRVLDSTHWNGGRPGGHPHPAYSGGQHAQRADSLHSNRRPPSRQDSGLDDILSHY